MGLLSCQKLGGVCYFYEIIFQMILLTITIYIIFPDYERIINKIGSSRSKTIH